MSENPSTESERLDEELVAYLDGELDGEAARRMEHRLASEETVRRRLQQLAQSWDLLDQLPRTTVDENFTRSTVEIVALAAEEELGQQAGAEPRRRWLRWLLTAVGAVAACWIGFVVVTHLRPDPNERLLRDLPVIENQEVLKEAGDIDFLRTLDKEGLFPEESGDAHVETDEEARRNRRGLSPFLRSPRSKIGDCPLLPGGFPLCAAFAAILADETLFRS